MIAYFLFLGFVFLLLTVDFILRPNRYGVFTLLAVVLVILFTVMRFETGYDYLNYVRYFRIDIFELIDSRIEWGFLGIVMLLKGLGLDYFWLFFLFGLAIVSLVFRGMTLYTTHVRIAFLIFLLIPGLFLNSFSIIRQSLAIALLFNGYYYLWNKCYRSWWMFAVFAVLFHYSALLVIPFLWLATKVEHYARTLLLIGIPLSLFLVQTNVVGKLAGMILGSSKFGIYIEADDVGASIIKLVVLNLSILPYLLFYKCLDSFNRSFLVLALIGLILLNVFSNVTPITRIAYYFKIFEIVLLANIVSFFKKGWSQVIFYLLLVSYFFTMFYASLSFDYKDVTEYPKLTPYKTILDR